MAKLELFRGDAWIIVVTVVDENGDAVDLSNAIQALFSVKANKDDTAYILEHMEGVITSPENGEIKFTIRDNDTDALVPGDYWYDVEVTFNDDRIHTVVCDELEIKADITRPHGYGTT